MTGPDDSHSDTRPLSVAELLAKNGTIGAPPVGHRHRRRRHSDSVTVAELTGEIPIVGADDGEEPETIGDEPVDAGDQAVTDEADENEAAYVEHRDEDPDMDLSETSRRPRHPNAPAAGFDAEQMIPDPLDDGGDELATSSVDADKPPEIDDPDTEAALDTDDRDPLPSYLRSTDGPLFGRETGADDPARRGVQPSPDDLDDEADAVEPTTMSPFMRGTWIVVQCIVAVAFGAGLFLGFDRLWEWNNIVALMLSVLVILGMVVGVRVVRKTEDIGSTLIAVAVGALVTLGPLALLQQG